MLTEHDLACNGQPGSQPVPDVQRDSASRCSSARTISADALLLSEQEWSDWSDFCQDGPLPAQPQLPVMLRRLGSASHRLAVMAERLGGRG